MSVKLLLPPLHQRLMPAVTWRHMSRRYLLVPAITLLFFASLVLLVTFAWSVLQHHGRETELKSTGRPTKKSGGKANLTPILSYRGHS